MGSMPTILHWNEVLIRLALATLVGTVIGLNRGEAGKAAGLRTTLLVCLAACLAMLQVNALLEQAGKQTDSFAVLDLMRLPLGILTGMGFIGGGAILRKGGLVTGVTTAATLWFVTVVGLCIGGGQIALGMIGFGIGLAVLWGLRLVEQRLRRDKSAWLTVEYDRHSACREHLVRNLQQKGCTCASKGFRLTMDDGSCEERFVVRWREKFDSDVMFSAFEKSATAAGARSISWSMDV